MRANHHTHGKLQRLAERLAGDSVSRLALKEDSKVRGGEEGMAYQRYIREKLKAIEDAAYRDLVDRMTAERVAEDLEGKRREALILNRFPKIVRRKGRIPARAAPDVIRKPRKVRRQKGPKLPGMCRCGVQLPPYSGRWRPRERCLTCWPPKAVA